jgi:hypothetical protein
MDIKNELKITAEISAGAGTLANTVFQIKIGKDCRAKVILIPEPPQKNTAEENLLYYLTDTAEACLIGQEPPENDLYFKVSIDRVSKVTVEDSKTFS